MSPRCKLGLHQWTPWRAHEPPCIAGPFITHYVRRCKRCDATDGRAEAAKATDCGGCPNDPAEYMHCPRWRSGDTACRPKEKK